MVATGLEGVGLLVARVLFGGVVAFMGLNHFMQIDQLTGYAQHKGLPAPKFSVLASGAVLVLGGFAVVLGAFPVVGALAVAGFLLASAVLMHDFWAVGEEDQQNEMINFLKNVGLLGGALVFLALGGVDWPYAVGVGLV